MRLIVLPGPPPGGRSSEPAATRALLDALALDAARAAELLGARDVDALTAGEAHLACLCPPSRARVRCLGLRPNAPGCRAWALLAEQLTLAAYRAREARAA